MITFRKVTKSNYEDIIKLDAGEEGHKHVAKNYYTLLQAFFEYYINGVNGIYYNNIPVGLFFYYRFNNTIWISRFMIDEKYQNKGIGKKAFSKLVNLIISKENPEKIEYLTSNPIMFSIYPGFKKVKTQRSKNYYNKYKEHLMVLQLK